MIKSYDFKSPKKFTKERMSTVENLYDSFARALAPYLTGLLQSYCEIRINRIVEKPLPGIYQLRTGSFPVWDDHPESGQ